VHLSYQSQGKLKLISYRKRTTATLLASIAFTFNGFAQEDDASRVRTQIEKMNLQIEKCQSTIKTLPEQKRFETEFFPSNNDPNRFKIFGSNQKITEEQKRFLVDALPIITKCRQIRIDGQVGLPSQAVDIEYYAKIDAIYGRLLRGEITIGEANEERGKASLEASAGIQKIRDARKKQPTPTTSESGNSLLPLLIYQQQMRDANDAADRRNKALIEELQSKPSRTDCIRDGWGNVSCRTK
jgi:hypothetical protein